MGGARGAEGLLLKYDTQCSGNANNPCRKVTTIFLILIPQNSGIQSEKNVLPLQPAKVRLLFRIPFPKVWEESINSYG